MKNFIVRELTLRDKESFNKVVIHPIQAWEWGEFRQKTGNQILRLGVFKNGRLKEGYQMTIHTIPFTPFRLAIFSKGPIPNGDMLRVLREYGRREKFLFIRMEPNVAVVSGKEKKRLEKLLRSNGAVSGKSLFTKTTFVIDLTKSEETLLKNMHPKTRYNIRLAERHNVKIAEDNSDQAFEKYLNLTEETTRRQNFFAHTAKYHRLMWQSLNPSNPATRQPNSLSAHLLTAKYQGKTLVAWIVFIFKDTLYYPFGASSVEHKNVMAPYAAMWGAIRFGKKMGLSKFDLWGREEGKGFTRFKEGFSPQIVTFLGTWDVVINPTIYKIYSFIEKLRWIFLKLPLPLPKPKFR